MAAALLSSTLAPGAWAARCRCCAARSRRCPTSPFQEFGPQASIVYPTCKLVDTHSHVHQAGDDSANLGAFNATSGDACGASITPGADIGPGATSTALPDLAACTVLAVSEADWPHVLALASKDSAVALIPGLGIHPWYVQDAAEGWQERLRALLEEHPGAVVGEIGLCKCAKNLRGPGNKEKHWPMQLSFFREQLAIAGALKRPATVHCVQAMGPLIDILKSAALDAASPAPALNPGGSALGGDEAATRAMILELPPALALHSYCGTALQVGEILQLERTGPKPPPENKILRRARLKVEASESAAVASDGCDAAQPQTPAPQPEAEATLYVATPPEAAPGGCKFFFGFSHTINVAMGCRKEGDRAKLLDAIRAVPDDRLLLESDEVAGSEGTEGGALGRAAGAMRLGVALVAKAKGWTAAETAHRTAANGWRFLMAGHTLAEPAGFVLER